MRIKYIHPYSSKVMEGEVIATHLDSENQHVFLIETDDYHFETVEAKFCTHISKF